MSHMTMVFPPGSLNPDCALMDFLGGEGGGGGAELIGLSSKNKLVKFDINLLQFTKTTTYNDQLESLQYP